MKNFNKGLALFQVIVGIGMFALLGPASAAFYAFTVILMTLANVLDKLEEGK